MTSNRFMYFGFNKNVANICFLFLWSTIQWACQRNMQSWWPWRFARLSLKWVFSIVLTNLNLLCTMKINLMLLFNEICKISWNKNFSRGWNCSFKGYISISFSVIIQINKDHIYSDLFIKSWFRRYICDVKIMHIKKSCSMDNCTPENS